MKCVVCNLRKAGEEWLCKSCLRSFDDNADGRSIAEVIAWAADRARCYAERRHLKRRRSAA